ncbi:type II toxin-antitoxin system RelE/ParE family toxin [Leeuwenhoekiella polynyae]|uniref:ParE-like toxin of type II ParDE toxin-antitoxin system n=1 Tax=Leeuwenhoekiella polynyae TaxID=1550906 RepID=A0A4Q0PGL1_9FLAO|nr:type II toxin-antitoxin system RelE/ParE family toxin [Leeuwenhoekiella polynyae]RXG26087.1 ParE-like toxin of type II ParDE toxin-antitoxin system [Leeuwenhoekiella polynyae]
MNVFLSELAEAKLLKLSKYLVENWGLKSSDKFILKLTERIKQIAIHPDSCPKSSEFKNSY